MKLNIFVAVAYFLPGRAKFACPTLCYYQTSAVTI